MSGFVFHPGMGDIAGELAPLLARLDGDARAIIGQVLALMEDRDRLLEDSLVGSTATGTPGSSAPGDSPDDGSSGLLAQSDHRHGRESYNTLRNGILAAGLITPYGGSSAPTGWLLCDGTSYLRADYAGLFAAIGTAFGSADGTHFNVPDLRQRFPIGKAASGTGSTLGGTGGAIDHDHTSGTHSHGGVTAGAASTSSAAIGGTANLPFVAVNFLIKT